jgi:hypothetical protein
VTQFLLRAAAANGISLESHNETDGELNTWRGFLRRVVSTILQLSIHHHSGKVLNVVLSRSRALSLTFEGEGWAAATAGANALQEPLLALSSNGTDEFLINLQEFMRSPNLINCNHYGFYVHTSCDNNDVLRLDCL